MFLYIHIPFCRRKCTYCKFALVPLVEPARIARYLTFLAREIDTFFTSAEYFAANDTKIESIYFGGGTPSVLSTHQVAWILDTIRSHASLDSNIEITFECHPTDITLAYAQELLALGINRISLGVETLHNESLAVVGRPESAVTLTALTNLFEAWHTNVSTDFIIGLPYFSVGQTLSDVQAIVERFPITHVSPYILESGKYPPEYRADEAQMEAEYHSIRGYLLGQGFEHYEISNFARAGFPSRHNRSYWNHSNVRGFGLSAASFWDGRRFTNALSIIGYEKGKYAEDEILTQEQIAMESQMFRLRTFEWICPSSTAHMQEVERCLQKGWLRKENGKFFCTPAWIFFVDHIMLALM